MSYASATQGKAANSIGNASWGMEEHSREDHMSRQDDYEAYLEAKDEFVREYDRSWGDVEMHIEWLESIISDLDAGKPLTQDHRNMMSDIMDEDWDDAPADELLEAARAKLEALQEKWDTEYDPDAAWHQACEDQADWDAYLHMIQVESYYW